MVEIFISYSHEDIDVMRRLRRDLSRVGFSIWTDEGITPGSTNWKIEVENAIRSCTCVVVMFSPEAARSRWVRAEIDFAETQQKPMFPVLVRGTEAESLPFGFAGYQHVDLRDRALYLGGINRLVAGVSQYLNTRPPEVKEEVAAETVARRGLPAVIPANFTPRRVTLPLVLAATIIVVMLIWLALLLTGVIPGGATPFSNDGILDPAVLGSVLSAHL